MPSRLLALPRPRSSANYLTKDPAFERRFQTIDVEEPSVEDTVKILTALQPRYEEHHHVRYTQGAIEAAANLSNRYIQDRFLPDKAIDLIDEGRCPALASPRIARPSRCARPSIASRGLKASPRGGHRDDDMNKAAEIAEEQQKAAGLNSPRPRLPGRLSSTPARSPSMSPRSPISCP